MTSRLRRPSPALAIALLALFVAAGGPAHAARLIDGKTIRKGTVRAKQVKDRTLTTRELARSAVRRLRATPPDSVTAAMLRPGSVGPEEIQGGAVNGERLAQAAVGSAHVADQALTSADLGPGSVTREELAPNSVTRAAIVQGGVAASEIAAGAVSSDEVADGALAARDVSTFAGTADVAFPAIAPGTCATAEHDVAPVREGADLTGDLVVAGVPGGWPAERLTLTARAAGPARIAFTACHVATAGVAEPVAPATHALRFLAFDL